MWFQVDEKALDDERIQLVAEELGIDPDRVFKGCCRIWCWLYKQGGRPLPEREVNSVSRIPGFAAALANNLLAEATPEGFRIHGDGRAKRYGEFCQRQRERVQKRYAPKPDSGMDAYKGPTSGSTVGTTKDGSYILSGSVSLFPELPEASEATRDGTAAEAWLSWFNNRFARSFRMSQELRKQIAALLRRGYLENPDLRAVALFLRHKWEGDAKMRDHLVPSTILRITKFAERLDQAREWYRQAGIEFGDESRIPTASVVKPPAAVVQAPKLFVAPTVETPLSADELRAEAERALAVLRKR